MLWCHLPNSLHMYIAESHSVWFVVRWNCLQGDIVDEKTQKQNFFFFAVTTPGNWVSIV